MRDSRSLITLIGERHGVRPSWSSVLASIVLIAIDGARFEETNMADWWTEIEGEILSCLNRTGITTPAEIGRRLGMPEAAAALLLSILVREGKVRMCLVELAAQPVGVRENWDGPDAARTRLTRRRSGQARESH